MAGLPDLLAWLDNKRRVAGRNLSDLINDPAGAVEQMDDQAKNFNRNTEPTIQGDQLLNRPMTEDQIRQKYTDLALNAPMGAMTAWHGSPHRFDKFSLDKIGTGEGAQAYGHGLYLAESRGVAESYADKLAQNAKLQTADGTVVNFGAPQQRTTSYAAANRGNATIEPWAEHLAAYDGNARKAINAAKKQLAENDATAARMASMGIPDKQADFQRQHWQGIIDSIQSRGKGATYDPGQYMYKTDIPDEAVARFLDWDKPLSQQHPDILPKARAAVDSVQGQGFYDEYAKGGADLRDLLYNLDEVPAGGFENLFKQQGIPGIRYLDGGSRSAGQGSSNFVAFDPEMIRILERNGQATGQVPWQPGEYRLKDLIGKE